MLDRNVVVPVFHVSNERSLSLRVPIRGWIRCSISNTIKPSYLKEGEAILSAR